MVRCTTLVLGILFLVTGCTSQQQCANVLQRLQSLSEAVQVMCGSSTTPPPATGHQQQCDCSYPVTWTSVQKTDIGSNNLQHAGTLTYTIPSVIPSAAREVLVLANLYCGWSTRGPAQDIKIYTLQGTQRYEKYLYMYSYSDGQVNTNSDNMWFPMTTNRRIYMEVPAAHGDNCFGSLKAIGYRWINGTEQTSSVLVHIIHSTVCIYLKLCLFSDILNCCMYVLQTWIIDH